MDVILLIHPDPVLREELTLILQDSGFQVAGVSGGQEALASISSAWPDLILLAESSHRLNGNELCVRIREICWTPIVILGQEHEGAAGVDLLEMGADVYLTSPLDTRLLLARIHSLLRRTKGYFGQSTQEV
ncbi:MAG: response regulator transcription factor [Dehalococcoidales bacterium]|nr:response regulator transcription factor [Dehalococcoidales bacterium]